MTQTEKSNGKSLVIVESPAKAKTINKYLGPDFQVLASMGHVRDLPSKSMSIDIENHKIILEQDPEFKSSPKRWKRLMLITNTNPAFSNFISYTSRIVNPIGKISKNQKSLILFNLFNDSTNYTRDLYLPYYFKVIIKPILFYN